MPGGPGGEDAAPLQALPPPQGAQGLQVGRVVWPATRPSVTVRRKNLKLGPVLDQ